MTQTNELGNGLTLWQEVQATDPAYTRTFQRSSGFSGTAINPTYLVRRMTEKFGPIGLHWGVEPLEEHLREGHVIGLNADGVPIRCVIHTLKVEVWYVVDGKRASVKQFGNTTFVGRAADGTIYTNEDYSKMSQTDGMSKCLSLLGFGGDVHLGLYDDAKYVADMEAAFSEGVLPNARNTTKSNDASQVSDAGNGQSNAQGGAAKFSKRYEDYKGRILALTDDDGRTAALNAIKADTKLSEMEKAMLKGMKELKSEQGTGDTNADATAAAAAAKAAKAAYEKSMPAFI